MKKYAVAFPGQGSQYISMGKNMSMHNKIVRDLFDEASTILGYDLAKLCFEGDIEELSKTDLVQPAILATSVSGFHVFMKNTDQQPSYLLGHSLGEISALVCSGAIDFSDGIKIVDVRGKLTGSSLIEDGYMAAVMGLDLERVSEICRELSYENHIVEISNINSEEQIVISGHRKAVDDFTKKAETLGGRIMKVNTGNPFHSSLMNIVRNDLEKNLESYQYHEFKYPVISNLTGECYSDSKDIPIMLSEQLVKPVQWLKSIQYIADNGINNIIEMKPQTILRNLMMTNNMGIEVYSDDDRKDQEYIKEITMRLSNPLRLPAEEKHKLIRRCAVNAVSSENKNFNDESYRTDVEKPYEQLIELQNSIVSGDAEPTYEDMKFSLDSLIQILNGKKISTNEKSQIMEDILYDTGLYELFPDYLGWKVK